jgi:hypothetical protein
MLPLKDTHQDSQKWAVMDPDSGVLIFFDEVHSPVPKGLTAIPITYDEWQFALSNPGHTITADGKLKAPEPPPSEILMAYNAISKVQSQLMAGITVTSKGTPAISGLYKVDESAQHQITKVMLHIALAGKFPGNPGATFILSDYNGVPRTFPSIAVFQSFAVAVQDYVADLTSAANNSPGSDLPPATVTIA